MSLNPEYVGTGRGPHINWPQAQAPREAPLKMAWGAPGQSTAVAGESGRMEPGGRRSQGSRRSRQQARREHRVEFTLTAAEFAAVQDAAGLARGAYAAQAVLAAAQVLSVAP